MSLKRVDPEIYNATMNELNRQRNVLGLIASENFTSTAVLEATGSVMTNKYAEGYPGKRYYGGTEFIDVAETLAIERAKKLFGADHANVQPHAGSQANMEAYFAVLKLKDKILAMDLAHGGHMSHGLPVNFSAKHYDFAHYGVSKETEMIDMDEVRKKALEHKPRLIITGASAYPREIDFKAFREIADEVGAYLMVDMAHIAGMIAAKVHSDPVPYADIITTTTHKTLRGPRGAMILCKKSDRFDPEGKWNLAQKIDRAVIPGMQGGPMEHSIAGKAVAFHEAMKPDFIEYQKQTIKNAKVLADELAQNGFRIVSGGTDNHLMLVDLSKKEVTGNEAEKALDKAGIVCNKNMIPFDARKPWDPSGIRLGTPGLTTRGMKEEQMKQIAEWISKIVADINNEELQHKIKQETLELCKSFPLYPELGEE